VLNPATELFLYQADLYDPAVLASELRKKMPVMVSCSTADIQVSCAEVRHLIDGLSKASARIDFVQLQGVDHVFKVDPSGASSGYTKPLPFSPQLKSALAGFAQKYMR
ncbi:MAG: hypothetical protein HKL84_05365, partial [Acidimicrobiaceae bacterium]|nr:hypothetical protein [Acidimicrobiaceae bacterium]